jgi:hypothetical protein
MENLFAYGTLILPDIQQKLFGRILKGNKDILLDFKKTIISIEDEVFPCVDRFPGNNIKGVIFKISDKELSITDEYEGGEYIRIKALLQSGNEAWVYIRA